MNITQALSILILIVMAIGTGALVMAFRPNSTISPEKLGRVMTSVIVTGLSAALALVIELLIR